MKIERIKHGYLYWAKLGAGSGTEPGKGRPVLVVQSDLLNDVGHPSTWVLFCTSQIRGESSLRVFLPSGLAGNEKDTEVLIDQGRSIDNRRFTTELGPVPKLVMKDVARKLALVLNLDLKL